MDRYTLQIGPGEPEMVPCKGGAWVRWDDVEEAVGEIVENVDPLGARAFFEAYKARQRRLSYIQLWTAIFFSALHAALFLIDGELVNAVISAAWMVAAVVWGRLAWPMPEKK